MLRMLKEHPSLRPSRRLAMLLCVLDNAISQPDF